MRFFIKSGVPTQSYGCQWFLLHDCRNLLFSGMYISLLGATPLEIISKNIISMIVVPSPGSSVASYAA